MRRQSKQVNVGGVIIGGGNPLPIQTMLTTKLSDVEKCLEDIERVKLLGCDVVRIALSKEEEKEYFKKVCLKSSLPIVADIQFNHSLAIYAMENGAKKIRINPCYIGGEKAVSEVAACAKQNGVPIRVGVNMGSLEKGAEEKWGRSSKALAESCLYSANLLEKNGLDNIVLSVKASDVKTMVEANRILASLCDYPLHIGATEAGTKETGMIKNAMGIGSLLLDGIGDTLRVSLSSDIADEVKSAKSILKSLHMYNGVNVVACPTCSRCNYDLYSLAKEIENRTDSIKKPLTIAVMGCVVNGIGEGKDADLGIAGGDNGKFVIFKKGERVEYNGDNPKEYFISLIEKEVQSD